MTNVNTRHNYITYLCVIFIILISYTTVHAETLTTNTATTQLELPVSLDYSGNAWRQTSQRITLPAGTWTVENISLCVAHDGGGAVPGGHVTAYIWADGESYPGTLIDTSTNNIDNGDITAGSYHDFTFNTELSGGNYWIGYDDSTVSTSIGWYVRPCGNNTYAPYDNLRWGFHNSEWEDIGYGQLGLTITYTSNTNSTPTAQPIPYLGSSTPDQDYIYLYIVAAGLALFFYLTIKLIKPLKF